MTTGKCPVHKLNNGAEIPAVGLGVFHSEPEQTVAAVTSAIEIGYRLIDTAAFYKNEQQVGEGVRASGVARKDLWVTTKLWMSDFGRTKTLHAFDRSLRKLGLDYVDMYMIHWPVPTDFEKTVESYDTIMDLVSEGRVRTIGVCNFNPIDLDKLIAQTGHIPAVNQVELHPFFIQSQVRRADEEHGILTQAWSPIGGIQRYGLQRTADTPDPLAHPTITGLGKKYDKSAAQIILRWQLELGNAVVPKSTKAERIGENFNIFDFGLTPEEVRSIDALDTGKRGGPDPQKTSPVTFPATIED